MFSIGAESGCATGTGPLSVMLAFVCAAAGVLGAVASSDTVVAFVMPGSTRTFYNFCNRNTHIIKDPPLRKKRLLYQSASTTL